LHKTTCESFMEAYYAQTKVLLRIFGTCLN